MFFNNNKGITLTELVVVMAVMSILAAVVMPTVRVSVRRSKEIELKRDLRTMRDAIDNYKKLWDEGRISKLGPSGNAESGYPKTLEDLTKPIELANGGNPVAQPATATAPGTAVPPATPQAKLPEKIRLLRNIPVDPMTGTSEWGMRSNQDEPDSEIWGGQDVFDVFSKSDSTALDGTTKYKDW